MNKNMTEQDNTPDFAIFTRIESSFCDQCPTFRQKSTRFRKYINQALLEIYQFCSMLVLVDSGSILIHDSVKGLNILLGVCKKVYHESVGN